MTTPNEKRFILMGKTETISLIPETVQHMLDNEGLYIASDPMDPSFGEAPLVSIDGKIWSVTLDKVLDPEGFIKGTQIDGPYRAGFVSDLEHRALLAAIMWEVCQVPENALPESLKRRRDAFVGYSVEHGEEGLKIQAVVSVNTQPRVYKLDDYEWWIGGSLEEIILQASKDSGISPEEVGCDSRELTNEELDGLVFTDGGSEEDGAPVTRTFREQLTLVLPTYSGPTLFAATEQ